MSTTSNAKIDELSLKLAPKLHILIVAVSDAWGGLEQTALNDTRMLVKKGFKISLLIKEDSPMEAHLEELPDKVTIIRFGRKVNKNFDFRFSKFLRGQVAEHGVNLVHLHQNSLLKPVVVAVAGKRHVALVISRHILNDHSKRDPIHALLYRRVDYMLVLSQTMKNNLLATFPLPEKKIRIVNLGVNLNRFQPEQVNPEAMRAELGYEKEDFLVGVVGRLDPAKGQDLIIKAIAQVRAQIPEVKGLIVGAETPGLDGAYLKELERSLEQLRLKKTIRIQGQTERIPEVMSALDLFVMPSKGEAFGLVALEAMAMRVPCIISQAGSAEELAMHGRAIKFRPNDAYDLANKIKYLYENTKLRRQIAERGHHFVFAEHSLQERLTRTLEIYMRCARRRLGVAKKA